VVYAVYTQCRESRKLLTNGQCPLYFPVERILGFTYVKFYHRANNYGKRVDGIYNITIVNKDGDIHLPLTLFTCTTLRYALLEWQKIKGGHLKASKSKLRGNRPDRWDYFNYTNQRGKKAACCATTGRK
jgi:hypothetical protein